MELTDQAVLITGGSKGLGRALGMALADRGARVVLVARGADALQQTVKGIRAAGGDAHAVVGDVGHKDDIYAIAGKAADLVGPIDLLIHNASTLGPLPMPMLLDTECEDLEDVLQTNLVGPFRLTKAILGPMILRGRGVVVGISSDAAVEGYPTWGSYGVSKAALDHLFRTWDAELADSGVRLFTVDPGEMDTDMHAAAMPDADRSTLADPAEVANRIARFLESVPERDAGTRHLVEEVLS